MQIIDSNDSHLPAITKIYAYAVKHGKGSFEIAAPDIDEMASRRNTIVSEGFPYLVAIIDDVVVGYAYVSQFRPRIAFQYSVEDSIYVHHEHHSKGIGEALLRELIQICTKSGHRQMVAVIGDSANLGSIKVHEKLGFHHVGNLKNTGRKFGKWVDTVMMQLELGEGDKTAPPSEPGV